MAKEEGVCVQRRWPHGERAVEDAGTGRAKVVACTDARVMQFSAVKLSWGGKIRLNIPLAGALLSS